MGYATRVVRPDVRTPRVPASSIPDAPSLRGGIAFPIEGGDWLVTLGWWHGDRAPLDDAGYLDFARSLPNPRIAEILETAESVGDVMTHGMPASQRRHVERLRRVPGGLVLLGDAICSFNPVYGQGMTSAAFQAESLATSLDQVDGTGPRFVRTYYKRAGKAVSTPWQISAGGDFAFPQTTGPKAAGTDLMNRYLDKVFRASHTSQSVAQRVLEVTALLAPPTVLLGPRIMAEVLRAAWRSPAPGAPELGAGLQVGVAGPTRLIISRGSLTGRRLEAVRKPRLRRTRQVRVQPMLRSQTRRPPAQTRSSTTGPLSAPHGSHPTGVVK
jgi:hypothetical protein